MSHLKGDAGQMLAIFRVEIPTFSGDVTRVAPDRGCVDGVANCRMLFDVEKAATDKLHRFLTHLAQGITAYRQMVSTAAQAYADCADRSRKELTDQVKAQIGAASGYDLRQNLPEYAPGFDRPAPAAP
ncbi:hypothetical protein BLA60_14590 [Actinophytocola xinjiangensis]|uniref:Uncharacterized protein n=1 Tax=Actinophytocola xinjiangensis TaxID=485602 RepID=A0A7Z1AZL4_9PSEU|nr:hypothetical protein [Actinophytocola xinjiangensis]OLF11198.1 hypothetical protein BLA60_14590 [Actinophytocola xinjiangensis]